MPEREDLQLVASNPVVNEVADATQIEPTHIWHASPEMPGTDAWLIGQEGDCLSKIGGDGPGCRRAIVRPPLRCGLDTCLAARAAILIRSATLSLQEGCA